MQLHFCDVSMFTFRCNSSQSADKSIIKTKNKAKEIKNMKKSEERSNGTKKI